MDRPDEFETEAILVDPATPFVREFLRQAILDGMARTVPAGPGRVLVLPTARWTRVGSPAVPEPLPRTRDEFPASLDEVRAQFTALAAETHALHERSEEVRAQSVTNRDRIRLGPYASDARDR